MRRDPLLKGRSRRELDDLFLTSHAVSESQGARGWSVSLPGAGSHAGGTAATAAVSRLPDVNPDLTAARLPRGDLLLAWAGALLPPRVQVRARRFSASRSFSFPIQAARICCPCRLLPRVSITLARPALNDVDREANRPCSTRARRSRATASEGFYTSTWQLTGMTTPSTSTAWHPRICRVRPARLHAEDPRNHVALQARQPSMRRRAPVWSERQTQIRAA